MLNFKEFLSFQLAVKQFEPVSIDSVLASLSKYGFDIGADIQPDVIKRSAGSILKVDQWNNKSRIIIDEEKLRELDESSSSSRSRGFSFLMFSRAVSWAKSNSKSSRSYSRSLSDQLKELNTASRDESEWMEEGRRIVPKTLNVARLSRGNLSKRLAFERIRIKTFSAPFQRFFTLYTLRTTILDSALDQLTLRIDGLEKTAKKVRH